MLTDGEIKELIFALLDCRKKLLWLTNQSPVGEEERKFIEHAKDLLITANQFLEEFHVQLPT